MTTLVSSGTTVRLARQFKFVHDFDSLKKISMNLFGSLPDTPNHVKGNKILRKFLQGEQIASYYPKSLETIKDPYFMEETEQRWGEKLERLKSWGKAPPKKGQGKRALKKKK